MTDNEIIKALELHAMDDDNTCDDCDYRACGCSYTLCKDAIYLINRLNIENENYSCNIKQLTSDHITLQNDFENAKSLYVKENKKVNKLNQKLIEICKQLKTAKAEAIKEFAEKIRETTEFQYEYYLCNIIDDLVKEMVAELPPCKTEKNDGLYSKYTVVNNSTGELVTDCFVLKPLKDKTARKALLFYADNCKTPQLSADIKEWLQELKEMRANNG